MRQFAAMHGVPYHTFYARVKNGYSLLEAAFFDTAKARSMSLPSGRKARRCVWEPHGMYRTPTHHSWKAMLNRCLNQKADNYPLYGGRGISVSERWMRFSNFLADMGERPNGTTLDRVNSNGNYEPSNCRWASKTTQRRNSSQQLHYLTLNGEKRCLLEWCKKLGLRQNMVRYRLAHGWPIERVLSTHRYNNNGDIRK